MRSIRRLHSIECKSYLWSFTYPQLIRVEDCSAVSHRSPFQSQSTFSGVTRIPLQSSGLSALRFLRKLNNASAGPRARRPCVYTHIHTDITCLLPLLWPPLCSCPCCTRHPASCFVASQTQKTALLHKSKMPIVYLLMNPNLLWPNLTYFPRAYM